MTRDQILDAAAQVFREKGFHAASMNDIARSVNLQKASLYHHIDSKQEILAALLDQGIALLLTRVGQVTHGPLSPEEKLTRAMCTYLQTLAEHGDLAAVLLFEHRSLDADMRAVHFPRRDAFEDLWVELIREGVDSGAFTCPDPDLAAKALLGVLNWTMTWFRPEGPLSATEIADQLASLCLNGLLSR